MSKLSRFIFGAYTLTVPEANAPSAFNVLITNNIPFGKTSAQDGAFALCLTPNGFRKYLAVCGGELIFGESAVAHGLFAVLRRYRLRTGMFLGILLFALSVSLSSFFIWDINVSGNSAITEAEIKERLAAYGVREGAFIPALDTNEISSRILLEAGNVSFMKINMRGTVASVEIRERKQDGGGESAAAPSNLVAKYAGQIERLEVTGGVPEVAYLQSVKEGELLVSGIIDSAALGYRLVRARGTVLARVTLAYESEIPLKITEKVYTGAETQKKSVKIFSKSLNLLKNTGVSYEKYDTIINEEKIYLFGKIELPIYVITQTHREYREEERTLTEKEALARALAETDRKSETELAGAEILSRKTEAEARDGKLFVRTEVYCILDIAEEVKIETD
ncbi:MAG: sporulation protein YqfD [Clostridia bacterium]|nr:sporulation protein YqfD [Clostridia bacterium]